MLIPVIHSVQILFKEIMLPEKLITAFEASVWILFNTYKMCPFSLNTASNQF